MKGPNTFVSKVLFFLGFVSYASAAPILLDTGLHHLVSRGLVSPSNAELLHNTIAFGVPAVLAYLLRMFNRGFVLKKFHKEDYLMSATMLFYLALLALINISAGYGTNLYPPEQEASILANPADVANRIKGSKIVIPLEQCMIASTWGVKLCIWTFLMRVFRQLPQYQRAMWYLLGYIALGFVVIEITYYGVFCRPFSQYWAMPVKNIQCATYQHYSILQMCFNITSDIALVITPIPMVCGARLPLRRKIVLCGVFGMAGFTVLAAILNKAYNFASPMTTVYQLWYIREASVAVCVGNLICTWQLFQRMFRLRAFNNKTADIRDEPAMPQFRPTNPIRVFRSYLSTRDKDTQYQTPNDGGESALTSDGPDGNSGTSGEDEKKGAGKNKEKGGQVNTTSYMMTLNRDGEGDARPALAFRDENQIE
ncbi:hypothetical protein N431DRAFT_418324 [Stipitochalara longipes BDJ]|nr:hypothetical protein N431DRAFT_418324 [Stipitochalara longipes BDJ]